MTNGSPNNRLCWGLNPINTEVHVGRPVGLAVYLNTTTVDNSGHIWLGLIGEPQKPMTFKPSHSVTHELFDHLALQQPSRPWWSSWKRSLATSSVQWPWTSCGGRCQPLGRRTFCGASCQSAWKRKSWSRPRRSAAQYAQVPARPVVYHLSRRGTTDFHPSYRCQYSTKRDYRAIAQYCDFL